MSSDCSLRVSLNFEKVYHKNDKPPIFCEVTPSKKFLERFKSLEQFNEMLPLLLKNTAAQNSQNSQNKLKFYNVRGEDGKDDQVWGFDCSIYEGFLHAIKSQSLAFEFIPLPANVKHAMLTHGEMKINIDLLNTRIKATIGEDVWNKLFEFQKECVRFCVSRGGRALIADDMGLGKTIESIAVAAYYKSEWPCLIICTAKCRPGWMDEIVTFLGLDVEDIEVIDKGTDLTGKAVKKTVKTTKIIKKKKTVAVNTVTDGTPRRKLFTIMSFPLVVAHQALIEARKYKMIIVDESQYTKNFESKRTQAITAVAKNCKYALFLSGTPLSKPKEIFPSLNALYPDIFPVFFRFGDRYCEPEKVEFYKGGKKVVITKYDGRTLTNELHIILSTLLMIRRLKHDVNIPMPIKTRIHYTLNPDRKQTTLAEKHMAKVDTSKIILNDELEQEFGKDNAFMNAYRKISKIKLPLVQRYVSEYISNMKDPNEKILLFGHHKAMLDGLQQVVEELNIGHVRLDGRTDKKQTRNIVELFQTNPECRVAILSMTSAGVGITLTAARTILFTEMHPSAEIIIQSECRAHRIGQKFPVECVYLVFPNSIEEVLWQLINKKYKSLTSIVDGKLQHFSATRITESND